MFGKFPQKMLQSQQKKKEIQKEILSMQISKSLQQTGAPP